MRSAKIVLVDDHVLVRQGIRLLIESEPGFHVIGEASDGHEAIQLCRMLQPDLVLLDIRMPSLNGIDTCRQILRETGKAKVIGLTMLDDRQMIKEMFQAGAKGYLLKNSDASQFLRGICEVLDGNTYICPMLTAGVMSDYIHPMAMNDDASLLTPREREVLQLLTEGNSTKQAALKLCVSVKTIETHRRNIMKKTDSNSIAELTKLAIRIGLTSLR